jgi:hypothetical protein
MIVVAYMYYNAFVFTSKVGGEDLVYAAALRLRPDQ